MEMLNGVCFPCKGGLFWYLNILNKLSHISNNKKKTLKMTLKVEEGESAITWASRATLLDLIWKCNSPNLVSCKVHTDV